MTPLLVRAAERAAADPHFLASRLGPDLRAAATRLGIAVDQCYHLYLCPVPASGCNVRLIAERCGVSVEVVWRVAGW